MSVIRISAVNDFLFCELAFYLIHKKRIKPKFTKAIYSGTLQHKKLEKEHPILGIGLNDTINLAFSGMVEKVSEREVWVRSEDYLIIGRIDEVSVENGMVRIIDDKKKPREEYKYQLALYYLAFKEMFGDYPVTLEIRDASTGKIMYHWVPNERLLDETRRILARMRDILEGRIKPKATGFPSKCKYCGVNYACPFYKGRRGS